MSVDGLLGRKIGMTQIFEDDGTAVPVTVIDTASCTIVQVKTKEKDGYEAVELVASSPRRLPISVYVSSSPFFTASTVSRIVRDTAVPVPLATRSCTRLYTAS